LISVCVCVCVCVNCKHKWHSFLSNAIELQKSVSPTQIFPPSLWFSLTIWFCSGFFTIRMGRLLISFFNYKSHRKANSKQKIIWFDMKTKGTHLGEDKPPICEGSFGTLMKTRRTFLNLCNLNAALKRIFNHSPSVVWL